MVYVGAEFFDALGEPTVPDLEDWIVGMDNPAGTGTCLVFGAEPTLSKKEAPARKSGRLVAIVGAA